MPTIRERIINFWEKEFRQLRPSKETSDNRVTAPRNPVPVKKVNPPFNPENIPTTRRSKPSNVDQSLITDINNRYRRVDTPFIREVIPVIRKLMMANEDVGQVIHNIVTLGNTGHKIFFDRKVPEAQVDAMRNHIANRQEEWASGTAGMDGLVNKFFSQVLVSGALSNEWVPNRDLTGVERNILVNPEEIEFVLDSRTTSYKPFQRVRNKSYDNIGKGNLIALNPNTYKYYGLNGDTEIPYGFPPYLAALAKVRTKAKMDTNIDFVVDQLGLIGFLEALIGKPEQLDGETDQQYATRLENLLMAGKNLLSDGMNTGIIMGFKDEQEFKFNSFTKDFQGIYALYKNNEQQIGSGLKQDPMLWGRDYNTSQASITVVFMKMISELRNIQNVIKANLQFGYSLDLRLAGYKFDYLTVQFRRSTISDDLKFQQAEEIKIRNVKEKMLLGLINQNQGADELDYEAPAYPEPRVAWEIIAGGQDPAALALKKQTTEKKKDASDRRVRDKKKPQ
jgi:hypothetical protein